MGPRDHMQERSYLTRSLCCPWGERKILRVWVRLLFMGSKSTYQKGQYHASCEWVDPLTGLCGCLTCWCPCITFGRIAEIVDRGSTSCGVSGALYTLILFVTGCSCLYSCFYRSKLRGQYFLEESPCTDCCIHCCCEECALCQEYRELKKHGFDMSIGWHGNIERQKREAKKPPAVQGAMTR